MSKKSFLQSLQSVGQLPTQSEEVYEIAPIGFDRLARSLDWVLRTFEHDAWPLRMASGSLAISKCAALIENPMNFPDVAANVRRVECWASLREVDDSPPLVWLEEAPDTYSRNGEILERAKVKLEDGVVLANVVRLDATSAPSHRTSFEEEEYDGPETTSEYRRRVEGRLLSFWSGRTLAEQAYTLQLTYRNSDPYHHDPDRSPTQIAEFRFEAQFRRILHGAQLYSDEALACLVGELVGKAGHRLPRDAILALGGAVLQDLRESATPLHARDESSMEDTQRVTAQGIASLSPNQKEDLYRSSTTIRNRMEDRLRRFIRKTLMLRHGKTKWWSIVLEAIPDDARKRMKDSPKSAEDLMQQELTFNHLQSIFNRRWAADFQKVLGEGRPQGAVDKTTVDAFFHAALRLMGTTRADAHASEITPEDVAALGYAAHQIDRAIRDYLDT
ncbi:MAG: hypothetical protein R3E85_17915 [Planctomycetota bacterium]